MKRTLTALAAVLLCTACAPAATTGPSPPPGTASSGASAPVSLSAGGRPQAPGGTVPPASGIAWDDESREEAAGVATRAMADYARPGTEATQWANDFAEGVRLIV